MNRALYFLGESSIANPDAPETEPGKKLLQIFDQSRREVLRRYPWNFCETWALAQKTTAPIFGKTDAYALPADFLRLIWVGDPDNTRRDYRLINQGGGEYRRVIAINNGGKEDLQIAYNADITLLHLWDPLAIKVFALWLALDIAKGVTGQDGLVETINNLLTEELKDAVAVDGQEQAILHDRFSYVQDERDAAQFGGGVIPFGVNFHGG